MKASSPDALTTTPALASSSEAPTGPTKNMFRLWLSGLGGTRMISIPSYAVFFYNEFC